MATVHAVGVRPAQELTATAHADAREMSVGPTLAAVGVGEACLRTQKTL